MSSAATRSDQRTVEDFAREVDALNGEIRALSAQHMRELEEKARLADQLQGLLRMLPTGVIVIGRRGRIDIANPAAEALLEHPKLPRLVGQPWGRVIQLAFRPQEHDGHEISLHNGQMVSLDTCALEGHGQLVVINDLTATRQLQAKVSQHQRLAGIGRMVASLAHQIRTPLSAAMLYTDNLRQQDLSPAHRARFAEKIQSRLEHLEKQVHDMLIFARGDVRLVDRVTVTDLLDGLRHASAAVLERSHSTLNLLNEAPDARVICNRDTLIGALCNLVNNAVEAVGQNASLNLRVQRAEGSLALVLQDHGPGIPEPVLQQLGEPFLTTKANGTGLGLAVVLAVVRAHGGQLTMYNTAQGACAHLTLPEYVTTETAS
ncbi:MAG: PAS domain-containing sensor histidine kinase [Natronospirillum sp.]|uniref:sensor histidine kinase n=1 Tax=Natronospirillum sp. TaxID=2812955 RepID=UPI0025F248EF|nr:ATP-binding protein [Natronospirillum sp.]MCH8551268.1 PAS domain-containing sensor histidine kinase [Natronospirillum sp.]